MKLTALAVVTLIVGIALGFVVRGGVFEAEAAPRFATEQLVEDSIDAFNQVVVQPIADAVAQLQGDVIDLDQRVTALETAPPPPVSTYIVVSESGSPSVVAWCDERDSVSGGGFSYGFTTNVNMSASIPVTSEGEIEGWRASWFGGYEDGLIAYAVCIDNPPPKSP